MKKPFFSFVFISMLVLLLSLMVFADGSGGWRQPTQPEKEFHHKVLTTIHQALPSGPTDWRQVITPDLKELTRVYSGTAREPFRIDYIAEWQDVNRKAVGDQKVLNAQIVFKQNHQNDPQVVALNKERQRLAEAVGTAAGKNDSVAMKRYMKEMDEADAKLKTIYNAWDKGLDNIAAANEAHDVDLKIRVRVNVFYSGLEKMTKGVPVAGTPVYRIPGGHIRGTWVGEQNRVFLGKGLQVTESNGLMVVKVSPSPGLPYTSARLIEVFIQADPARARQVLESINWELLKGLTR